MFISKTTRLGSNVSKLKCLMIFAALSITILNIHSNVLADEYGSALSSENATHSKSQATNFFLHNEGDQNFFSNRNFSSTTIFNNTGEPSLVTNSVIQPQVAAPAVVEESFAVEQTQATNQNREVAETQQEISNVDPSSLSINTDLDPNLKDVMEHSRKIREAIFGEEAAGKLPTVIREKLQGKFPAANPKSTRF